MITALVIDEAQSLPYELLEEIRLLANIETNTEKLLPLVLAGQPELADRLNEPSLRQLKQRVALRCTLGPLTREETAAYITGRIRHARRRARAPVHAGGGGSGLPALARHAAHHQRDLRQRAGQRLRAATEAGRRDDRAGGLPGLRFSCGSREPLRADRADARVCGSHGIGATGTTAPGPASPACRRNRGRARDGAAVVRPER